MKNSLTKPLSEYSILLLQQLLLGSVDVVEYIDIDEDVDIIAVDEDVVSVEYVNIVALDIGNIEVSVGFVVEDIDINVGDERVGAAVDVDNTAVDFVDFNVDNVDVDFVGVEAVDRKMPVD